ncbi:MAG TPA: MBL fold metallo-hydrolase [Pseudolabrys sp.]|uniref:MBL fold metallo-hydrolase n=1 Tax=Pseudolabrys sp. TaxID=1960880 RepID=UPI002DDD524E|nr:MBL fold metallo-hydrolase [Pseudolabrys sp.]HEV2627155.1 MBL fold metallo-hydrolase [Pseudolabrys sp.]
MFKVGEAAITRIEETFLPTYPLRTIFPEITDAQLEEYMPWMAPHHYDPKSGCILLSVHSWLLKVGGQTILIDACCGNNKVKPGRPFWHMLNEPYLARLAAVGVKPEDVDVVMCTHLHHDHVGWNTINRDGKWVPTFPNARYVFSRPDVDYFSKIDADPKEGPAELGTFRECVVPILEYGKADLVSGGAHRLNDFIEIDSAPGHSPGHVFFKLESKGERAAFVGDVWHHLLQVHHPDWNFPKNSDVNQARASRRKVLDHCAATDALVFPGHVGLPFAGRIEKTQSGYRPHFQP